MSTKFQVSYKLISHYTVEVEAGTAALAKGIVNDMGPSELEDLNPVYDGWDLEVTEVYEEDEDNE